MSKTSTRLTGAIVGLLILMYSAIAFADVTQEQELLDRAESGVRQAATITKEDSRNKVLEQVSKDLDQVRSKYKSDNFFSRLFKPDDRPEMPVPVRYRMMLVGALLTSAKDPSPNGNGKYAAAGQLRRLVAKAGPGALAGNPANGWSDPTLKKAYQEYLIIAESIDKANRRRTVYGIVDFLVGVTGRVPDYSYWLAIIILTLLVKIVTTPLSHLQFESMRNMQRLQPKIEKLKKELADDPRELQRQQWQLLKDNNASPQWGCLALLVQMPFLIFLYQMIRAYEFQFAKGTFLWIGSGLKQYSFIGTSLADPDWPLLLLYGLSMYVSTRMSSPALDKQQADQQKMMAIMMPAMFVMIFNTFSSAFILYWLALNVLTTTQQYFMLKKPVPALALEDEDEDLAPETTGSTGLAPRSPRPRKRR